MAISGSSDNQNIQIADIARSLENMRGDLQNIYSVQTRLLDTIKEDGNVNKKSLSAIRDTMERQKNAISGYIGRNTSRVESTAGAQVSATSALMSSTQLKSNSAADAELDKVMSAISESLTHIKEASKQADVNNSNIQKLIGVLEKQSVNSEAVKKLFEDIKSGKIDGSKTFLKQSGIKLSREEKEVVSPYVSKLISDVKASRQSPDEKESNEDDRELENKSNEAIIELRDLFLGYLQGQKTLKTTYKNKDAKNEEADNKNDKNDGNKPPIIIPSKPGKTAEKLLTVAAIAKLAYEVFTRSGKIKAGMDYLKDLKEKGYTDDQILKAISEMRKTDATVADRLKALWINQMHKTAEAGGQGEFGKIDMSDPLAERDSDWGHTLVDPFTDYKNHPIDTLLNTAAATWLVYQGAKPGLTYLNQALQAFGKTDGVFRTMGVFGKEALGKTIFGKLATNPATTAISFGVLMNEIANNHSAVIEENSKVKNNISNTWDEFIAQSQKLPEELKNNAYYKYKVLCAKRITQMGKDATMAIINHFEFYAYYNGDSKNTDPSALEASMKDSRKGMIKIASQISKTISTYLKKLDEAKTISECDKVVVDCGNQIRKIYFDREVPNQFFTSGWAGNKSENIFGFGGGIDVDLWQHAYDKLTIPSSLYGGSGDTSMPTDIDVFPEFDDDYFKEIAHGGMKFRIFGNGDIKFQKNGQWHILPRNYAERGRLYGQDASDDPYIESGGKAILGIPYTPGVNGGIEDLWFEILHRLIQEIRQPEKEKRPESPPQSQDNSVTINQNMYHNPHRSLNGDLIPISVRA